MKLLYNVSMCTIVSLLIVMSGCGKTETPGDKPTDTNASVTNPVENGDSKSLSFYLIESESYDPAFASSMHFANVGQAIFEGLVKYKENSMEVEPALATSWEVSPDMKTYKFALRQDVKFHDGTKFNADSVLYSFERQMKDKRTDEMYYAGFVFDPVSKIEKLDEYTVNIILSQPQVTFLTNLAMYFASPIISQEAHKKDAATFAKNPMGTGPYKMVKHDEGKSIELELNKEYWGNKPKIANININLEEKEVAEKMQKLTNGKIDLLLLYTQKELDSLKSDDTLIAKNESLDTYYIAFNCSTSPFNNKNFRQGVSHLINRDEFLKDHLDVYAQKAETLIPPSILGFNSKLKAYNYDVTKANELLKNFPKDKEISIMYDFEDFKELGQYVADGLSKAGIKSKLEFIEGKDFADRYKSGNYGITIQAWQSDNGDPDNFVFLMDSASIDSTSNYAKYSNPEFDALVAKGKVTLKNDERVVIYQKADEILAKDAPILPMYHSGSIYAYSKKIKNFYKSPAGVLRYMYYDKG